MNTRMLSILGLGVASIVTSTACSSTTNGGSSSGEQGGTGGTGANGGTGRRGRTGGQGGAGGGGGSGNWDPNACVTPTRMDLLFAIDNSRSMADKQDILSRSVPDLVQGLVNPPCHDPTGTLPPTQ